MCTADPCYLNTAQTLGLFPPRYRRRDHGQSGACSVRLTIACRWNGAPALRLASELLGHLALRDVSDLSSGAAALVAAKRCIECQAVGACLSPCPPAAGAHCSSGTESSCVSRSRVAAVHMNTKIAWVCLPTAAPCMAAASCGMVVHRVSASWVLLLAGRQCTRPAPWRAARVASQCWAAERGTAVAGHGRCVSGRRP